MAVAAAATVAIKRQWPDLNGRVGTNRYWPKGWDNTLIKSQGKL